MHCVVAKFFCVAVLRIISLQGFSAKRSHTLCHCEIFLRSDFTFSVVARFICGASHALCRCETFLRSISRSVSLRDFFAEQSHALCPCETFLHTTLKLTTSLLL